jgi:hypothetical protein
MDPAHEHEHIRKLGGIFRSSGRTGLAGGGKGCPKEARRGRT